MPIYLTEAIVIIEKIPQVMGLKKKKKIECPAGIDCMRSSYLHLSSTVAMFPGQQMLLHMSTSVDI